MQNDFLDRHDKIQRLNRNLTGGNHVSTLGNIFGRLRSWWIRRNVTDVPVCYIRDSGGHRQEEK